MQIAHEMFRINVPVRFIYRVRMISGKYALILHLFLQFLLFLSHEWNIIALYVIRKVFYSASITIIFINNQHVILISVCSVMIFHVVE